MDVGDRHGRVLRHSAKDPPENKCEEGYRALINDESYTRYDGSFIIEYNTYIFSIYIL
jgi:hypothetical protein